MSKMIEVVGGLVIRNGRVLLTQRVPEKDYAYAWESPGGKVKGDESHHEALRRELTEEIDVDTGPLPEDAVFSHDFVRADGTRIFWLLYRVPVISGTPRAREGQGIGWFTVEEMSRLHKTPGNVAAATVIANLLAQ